MAIFQLSSDYSPTGDQPRAIVELTEGLRRSDKYQTLLGWLMLLPISTNPR
jgi:excinuclease ABC subunit B